ncbi:ribosomal protein S18-alanine N-acetyltransferase [bacterium AH-315-P07]|nr:ribosomal protein S18-alanine N-acetyltransferase [bacterium AH-315-P07]
MTITSTSKLRYGKLTEALIPQLQVIEEEAYPEPWTTGMFREEMTNRNSYFYVAYVNDTLIGYSGFWLLMDDVHITSVTVASPYRGNRFGHEQMEHLLHQASDLGAITATLEVRESNHAARAMYTQFGFKEIGLRKGYYAKSGEDAIVMQLGLSPDIKIPEVHSGD